jgi:hypothetical protein
MSELAFDLEQDILRCWNVVEDIGEILDDLESGHMEIHEAAEALRAYQKVYQRRFERCFGRFEEYNRVAWTARNRVQELEQVLGGPKNPTASMGKKGKSKQQKEVDN